MHRLGYVLLLVGLAACSDGRKEGTAPEVGGKETTFENFTNSFPEAKLPYQVTDTALARHADTAMLRRPDFVSLLPDSVKRPLLGSGNVRYQPLARIATPDQNFLVVRAASGERSAALLYVFDKKQAYKTVFPLLVPDSDPATAQASLIDKQGAITRSISKKIQKDLMGEGREVFVYTPESNSFTLIMTDPLEDRQDVLNPIDTFARKHPLAGDYVKNERNFVSVRDARNPSEINFFIHFEKGTGDDKCTGELKGTALLTSSRTAVYRQGGDPCVLELQFSGNSVTLRETEGCGSHRGVKCIFDGNFPRKKAVSAKSGSSRKAKK
ncbi:hypothetical protein EPD60_15255 [Flaviaesturariibacter flavus]|uniref:Uncharacterized protein n=1 Tax=Flaviaesturariibacter flavus TaxID=2502780 RepID=A0A4R1B3F6_9BACT|nr:hypothetical protein [Flaviaesturariibacter flavus]TCJ12622.1 hypothetical protein EPD60_15255 [Flaviaesturariibacter flavus]